MITEAERSLAAAQAAAPIQQQAGFTEFELPALDLNGIQATLARDMPELDAAAAAQVQTHLAKLGPRGENWVGDGMSRIAGASAGHDGEACPFCAQSLEKSPVIAHYRAYFATAYQTLKSDIARRLQDIERAHGGDIPAAFERAVRVAMQGREFWQRFMEVPNADIDTAAVART